MTKQLNEPSDTKELLSCWCYPETYLVSKEPAIYGTVVVEYRGNHKEVTDPTWLDLRLIGDQLIQESGDAFHCFIEDFIYCPIRNVWSMHTGS